MSAAAARPAGVARAFTWRPLRTEERQLAFIWGLLAVCSLLLRPVWLAAAPLLPACPFRWLTGVPCLSCGTTRAAVAVLDGRLLDALAFNPLATLAGVAFLAGGALAPLWALAGMPLPSQHLLSQRAIRIGLGGALLAGWAWVITTG